MPINSAGFINLIPRYGKWAAFSSRSDLWSDGPDFSGSNVPYEGLGPPCPLRTSLSGAEKGPFELTWRSSDYLNYGNSPIYQ